MSETLPLEALPFGLDAVLRARGFDRLMPIQSAVLDPAIAGRDLRIASQTGSGKTVAVGIVLAEDVQAHESTGARKDGAQPTALIVAPTRELAAQIAGELGWLFEPWRATVVPVTGGTSIDDEIRRLRRGPAVVVGTPGRLLDHLRRGVLRLDQTQTIVLDEADEMLDMGFEEELDAVLSFAPEQRRTHLVSATFAGRVAAVADRVQNDPVWIHGSPLGAPNEDIEHLVMLVEAHDRLDALINVLLRYGDDKTIVFSKTRAGTQELASALVAAGFSARALSGEMSQRERSRTLEELTKGTTRILVATDVAARGIDVSDVARVIQVDPPQNGEVLTHRSGRTGRAGQSGVNILFAAPRARRRIERLLNDAGLRARFTHPPRPDEILAAADERLMAEIRGAKAPDEAALDFAERLLEGADPKVIVAHLLGRMAYNGPTPPRALPEHRVAPARDARPERRGADGPRPPRASGAFVTFQVSWGAKHGADARRLLALVCRRGGVTREDVGAIRVGPASSTVEVSGAIAESFEEAVRRPDARDARVRFRRWLPPEARANRPSRPPPGRHKPRKTGPGPKRAAPRNGDKDGETASSSASG